MSVLRLALILFAASAVAPPPGADGARVLAYFGISSKSHNNFFTALTTELANRGHELTVVTTYPLKNPPEENYRQITATVVQEFFDERSTMEDVSKSVWQQLLNWRKMTEFFTICEDALHLPEVKALKKEKFDLVIVSLFLNDCAFPFAWINGAPLVLIAPAAGPLFPELGVGNPEPRSYVPNLFLPFTDHMTFAERLINTLSTHLLSFLRWAFYWPAIDATTKEFFGPNTPSSYDLMQNTSLMIFNGHFSLNYPKPLVPAVVEAGGMQIKKSIDPLPKDMQKFIDGAKEGVIYFSMGSILKAKDMKIEKVRAFAEAFAELPQRVVWKWEGGALPIEAKNIKTAAWMPQQAILAHPNVKLFITHGGMLSTQEASYNGVPLVGIPMMGDQLMNVKQSENMGYALGLPYDSVTKESVLAAVKKVLGEPKYRENAKKLQARVLDQPQKPLERAVFWTEYVMRHNGAYHMRSAAVDLSWYQLHLIDVYLVIFAIMATPLILSYCIIKRLLCSKKISSSKRKVSSRKKKD